MLFCDALSSQTQHKDLTFSWQWRLHLAYGLPKNSQGCFLCLRHLRVPAVHLTPCLKFLLAAAPCAEVVAGLTTFLAMVYSVIVVPGMLGKAGFRQRRSSLPPARLRVWVRL
ncbi:hypothetical protein EIN43_15680 [Enterobacter hormaechei]|uniref:Uncharacterized protein n=1 Tax=Enterobacter hormaechei TaxID=158836 RepID=A0A4Y5ZP50_9ENTR|nr:hypothetical protein EIN43_15680 [Enterobacter hormaechei]